MAIIFFAFWIFYCCLEGIYDGWVYYAMPERVKYLIVVPFMKRPPHIPHLIAFVRRTTVAYIVSIATYNGSFIDINLVLIGLSLILPLWQTGFYLEARSFVHRRLREAPPKDAKLRSYNFFSFTRKDSSTFPDYSPIFRVFLFIVGTAIYFFILK